LHESFDVQGLRDREEKLVYSASRPTLQKSNWRHITTYWPGEKTKSVAFYDTSGEQGESREWNEQGTLVKRSHFFNGNCYFAEVWDDQGKSMGRFMPDRQELLPNGTHLLSLTAGSDMKSTRGSSFMCLRRRKSRCLFWCTSAARIIDGKSLAEAKGSPIGRRMA
jgi:hypothetical protein